MGKLSKLPKIRPIHLDGGFTLAEKGLEVRGFPSFEQYQAVGQFIERAHAASGWWLADWIVYGDSRPDWKAEIDQAVGIDELQPQTVRQYRMLAKKFPLSNRIDGVDFGHHAVVANLEPELQMKLLKQAATERWTQRELAQAAKAAQKPKVIIEGQAVEVYEVEVSVLVTLEAQTANLAEQGAWAAMKALVDGTGEAAEYLKAKVIAARRRPKLEEG